MFKHFTTAFFVIFAAFSAAYAQFPQAEQWKQRIGESEGKVASNRPEPYKFPETKLNVDVQMTVSNRDVKTFAEARSAAVTKLTDGEQAWLYIKFAKPLGTYVFKKTEDGAVRSVLYLDIGTAGQALSKTYQTLDFNDDDLKLTELKIALSPGAQGRNRSSSIFLRNSKDAAVGTYNNQLRLTNRPYLPRADMEYLAKVPLTTDLSKGTGKYTSMLADFNSIYLRGTTDITKLPAAGKFDDAGIKAELTSDLNAAGISPESIYFTDDTWLEYSDSPMMVAQSRKVFATFTYKRDQDCLYGTAEIVQNYDPMNAKWGASNFKVERDLKRQCTAQ